MNDSSCIFEIIHAAVSEGTSKLSVSRMCEIAGVSRSGYYAWVKAAPKQTQSGKPWRSRTEKTLS